VAGLSLWRAGFRVHGGDVTGYDPRLVAAVEDALRGGCPPWCRVADHLDVGDVHLDGAIEMYLGEVHVLLGVRQLFDAPAPEVEVAVNTKLVARMSLARARRRGHELARSPHGTDQQLGRGLLAAAAHVQPTPPPAADPDRRGGHPVG
jgi:hypothetical protein